MTAKKKKPAVKASPIVTPITRTPARARTPRPVLAMAAPPLEQCIVKIEKLKGGEANYSITVPGHSLTRTVDRALQEYKRLGLELLAVQQALVDAMVHRHASVGEGVIHGRIVEGEQHTQADTAKGQVPRKGPAQTDANNQANADLESPSHAFPPRG